MNDFIIGPTIPIILAFAAGIIGIGSLFYRYKTEPKDAKVSNVNEQPRPITQLGRSDVTRVHEPEKLDWMRVLPVELASEGIRGLIQFATILKPDHVIGINRGGAMLGASVCLAVGVANEKFHKCGVTKNNLECDIDINNKTVSGTVLVVDDIARSGATMRSVLRHLTTYEEIEAVHTAALVAALDEDGAQQFKDLDFSQYISENADIYMPWIDRDESSELEAINTDIRIADEFHEVEAKEVVELATEVYKRLHPSAKNNMFTSE